MTRLYYKEASACVIMFDVTNSSTFSNSQKWKQDLDSKLVLPDGSPVPCLLLANKVSGALGGFWGVWVFLCGFLYGFCVSLCGFVWIFCVSLWVCMGFV